MQINNRFSESRGINSALRHEEPYIEDSPGCKFTEFFPIEKEFIINLEGKIIHAIIRKGVQNKLFWIDKNMYEYFCEFLHLVYGTHITFDYLDSRKMNELYFVRKNETEFFASFNKDVANLYK